MGGKEHAELAGTSGEDYLDIMPRRRSDRSRDDLFRRMVAPHRIDRDGDGPNSDGQL